MGKFEVNILGCGSALPTARHYPSTQILNIRDNLFMIDCGEGAQIQFRRMRLKFTRLGHIFLSHLHGDHCFGLIGMISTFALVGRTGELVIHAHPQAEQVFRPQLDFFCRDLPFTVRFEPVLPNRTEVIYEDKSIRVRSLPMIHRVPCSGFLFEEKVGMRHLLGDMMNFYNVPVYRRAAIKAGEDFVTSDGRIIPNSYLTTPADPPLRYAYCSDTAYSEKLIPWVEGVDLLYHEATFAHESVALAKQTTHSTARQAATIALWAGVKKLMIGHFSARYNDEKDLLAEACEVFPETILAYEGLKYLF